MGVKRRAKGGGNRQRVIAVLFLIWMGAIVWRLGFLQITRHDSYRARAESQRQDTVAISPLRGAILDRRGAPLAASVDTVSVYAYRRLLRDRAETARLLAPLLGERAEELGHKLEGEGNFVWLKRRLDQEAARRLDRELPRLKLDGVEVVREPQRHYPNESLAAHLLGSVNVDGEGLEGLELHYDRYLRGKPGELFLEKDSRGRAYGRRELPAVEGAQLLTTIDAELQHQVEAAIEEAWRSTRARGVTAIVLDVRTGGVLALANAPSFDPNRRPKRGEEALRRNRAVTDIYEPGSVFKTVTYSAALGEGKARPDEMVNCLNGRITLGKRTINDTHAYGLITVADALAKSSNVGAIKMAQRVGEGRLADYIRAFGFGRKTGIDLPGEVRGMVHDVGRWQATSYASIAIGQEIGVTALQAVSMMAAVANGGVWTQPHIVRQAVGADGAVLYRAQPEQRRVLSEETARTISGMLAGVVEHGTARRTVQLAGYTAAGKTGTPQKVDPATGRYSHTKYFPNFAGFVPASDPRFAIIVAIDEPIGLHQGGTVAAPVFDRIAEAALSDYAVPPDAGTFRAALAKLEDTFGSRAAELAPAAGGALRLEPGVMPDLQGRSVRAVAQACGTLSLKARLEGSGFAVRQRPAPGASVQAGDACEVEFQ